MAAEAAVMQTPGDADNFISPIGYRHAAVCGYCKGNQGGQSKKRFSYYATAFDVSPAFYQTLIDRCWRRSGTLLYRPNQRNACCPHYTLRLDSAAFKPTKDQRQAINRFNRHVLGDKYLDNAARHHPRSREETRRRDTVFDLVERIHEAEREFLPPSSVEPARRFTVSLEPDTFTEEKYAVFENYQRVVHGEKPSRISRKGFTRFLCNSPIRRTTVPATEPGGKERLLGSYHQCYRLDGVLVAIGVLDLLPHSVSAVYFLYHESIHAHNPGKLGALREIAFALDCGYKWWYSGFYIHTCPKMRYKMDYSPQSILDPQTLAWHQLGNTADGLGRLFDSKGTARFAALKTLQSSKSAADRSVARNGIDGGGAQETNDVMTDRTVSFSEDDEDSDDTQDEDVHDEGCFLLRSKMPGVLSLEQVSELDMGRIAVRFGGSDLERYTMSDLAIWHSTTVDQFPGFKSRVGELVAAIGADLMDDICVDFVVGD